MNDHVVVNWWVG